MSYRVYITLREVKELTSGKKWIEAHIFDEHDCDSLAILPKEIPYKEDGTIDVKALFIYCLRTNKHPDWQYPQITGIFDLMYDSKSGITVEDVYLPWEEIEDLMKKHWEDYDPEQEMQTVIVHIEYSPTNKCKLKFSVSKELTDDNEVINHLVTEQWLDSQEAKHVTSIEFED